MTFMERGSMVYLQETIQTRQIWMDFIGSGAFCLQR